MAGNFAAHWPTNPKLLELEIILLKKNIKNQEAASILKVCFAFLKWPHFHEAYLVIVRKRKSIAVCDFNLKIKPIKNWEQKG